MLRTLLALGAIAMALANAEPADARHSENVAAIQVIDLDGRRVRVQTTGLANRKPGTPIIVFEAGATQSLEAWSKVIPETTAVAPVVAYDRAGLGQSEWDGSRPTPRHVTDRLRRLLQRIGAVPPYVLVGHSWGGMLAYYHAGFHPADIAGLVFVDPAPVLTQEPSGNYVPFEAIGAGRQGFDVYWSSFAALMNKGSPAARAEFEVFRGLVYANREDRDLPPLPQVPVVVLVAGKYLHLPFFKDYPFDARAHFEADLRHRSSLLQEWALASNDGLLVVSRATTHAIPQDDPQMVIWGIKEVLKRTARQGRAPTKR